MPIINYNVSWMIYNSCLALLAVGLGYLTVQVNGKFLKFFIGLLWLIFLPNTIYIFTDLEHLVRQWHEIQHSQLPFLILQYAVFEVVGVITFLFAFLPFEKIIRLVSFLKKNKTKSIIVFNFVIAFGMVLGRIERINSWEVFTNPLAVITSAVHVLLSFNLLGLTLLFGFVCNFIYFLFRDGVASFIKKFLH